MENLSFLNTNQITELEKLTQQKKVKLGCNNLGSLALGTINKNKKNQKKFYLDISFLQKEINLPNLDIETLIEKKILKFISKKEERLTFTLKAILIIEYRIKKSSNELDTMLNDLNNEFFEKIMDLSEEPVTSLEKAIIITLLGLGALSDDYSLKIKEENQEYVKDAVDRAAKFIESLGPEFNDGTLAKRWAVNVIGEGPILGMVRRLNKIPIHTEGIYKSLNKGHYLDILINNKVDERRMTYLLDRIFDKRPPFYEEKKELIKTLDEIQKYEFKLFKKNPPFEVLEVRKQMKRFIESNI